MAYHIEYGQSPDESFYAEFLITNKNTGNVIRGDGIDHQLNVYGPRLDYGTWGTFGYTIASNSNGLITCPAPGVVAINVPMSSFFGVTDPDTGIWSGGFDLRRQSLKAKLLAVPADPNFTKTLANIKISFGDRLMACPRVQLDTYPLYPNAPSVIAPVGAVEVAQVKQQLAKIGQYDAVEAALAGPTDPATISWNTGGSMSLGGPLSNVVQLVAFANNPVAMAAFLTLAALNML